MAKPRTRSRRSAKSKPAVQRSTPVSTETTNVVEATSVSASDAVTVLNTEVTTTETVAAPKKSTRGRKTISYKAELAKMTAERDELQTNLETLAKENTDNLKEIADSQAKIEQLVQKIKNEKTQLISLTSTNRSLEDSLTKEANAVLEKTQKIQSLEADIFNKSNEIALLTTFKEVNGEKSRVIDKIMDDLNLDFKLDGKLSLDELFNIIVMLRAFIKEHLYYADGEDKLAYWHWPKAYQVTRWYKIGKAAVKFINEAIAEINS